MSGCQVLDYKGDQCNNKILKLVNYHGDSEIYDSHFEHDDYDCRWVRIGICKKHYRENGFACK